MESRRGEKTFKSILRRQGERTTATRFSQYPPLSLRNEAEQRRATEKYFCQTERARSSPLIIRLVGSTPRTKGSSPPPSFRHLTPSVNPSAGEHHRQPRPAPSGGGASTPQRGGGPAAARLYVRMVKRTYKLQVKTRERYWELLFKGI